MKIELLILVAFVAAALGVVGGALAFSLRAWMKKANAERAEHSEAIKKLEEERDALLERVQELESNGPKRLTHSQAAGYEDAIGIALDLLEEYASSQRYTAVRTDHLYKILMKLREGPNAYPIDATAGQRPYRKRDE